MRESGDFRFKQFRVQHQKSTMKVGTDAVLIGAWTEVGTAQRILDIGTGCGIIALMLAQQSQNSKVIGIDIDQNSVKEALANAENSPWIKRIQIEQCGLQDYEPDQPFDLIVSNPPFFNEGTASPEEKRATARHTISLSFKSLMQHANRLLNKTGRLSIIIPADNCIEVIRLAKENSLYINRIMEFRSKEHRPIERSLMMFSRIYTDVEKESLVHYNSDGEWTHEYIGLTKDFYLKL